jgi:hypothetical protein
MTVSRVWVLLAMTALAATPQSKEATNVDEQGRRHAALGWCPSRCATRPASWSPTHVMIDLSAPGA